MALNDIGSQRFDAKGMCQGMLLTANDAGSSRFDAKGKPEGELGTFSGRTPRNPAIYNATLQSFY